MINPALYRVAALYTRWTPRRLARCLRPWSGTGARRDARQGERLYRAVIWGPTRRL